MKSKLLIVLGVLVVGGLVIAAPGPIIISPSWDGTASYTTTGTITAEQLTSTDDADINDSLTCGDVVIDEAAGTLSFTGATSARIYGPAVTGDNLPPTMTVEASDASAAATAAANKIGGPSYNLAGLGTKVITIDSYADCAGGHIHLIYGAAATPDTLTTSAAMTQGVEWACADSNDSCATTLASYLNGLTYVDAIAAANVVQITPAAGVSYLEFTDSTGAACMTITSSNDGINYIGGRVRIGKPGTPASATANGDAYFGSNIEVYSSAYLNNVTISGNSGIYDAKTFLFGNSSDAGFIYSTAQTQDSFMLGVGADSNGFIICEKADMTYDFNHSVAQTNPTVWIHSANQSQTEYGSLAHNQTDFVVSSGAGDINFAPAGGDVNVTGNIGTSGDLVLVDDIYANAIASDAAPAVRVITSQPIVVTPGATNVTGSNIVLAPSPGERTLEGVTKANTTGDTLTFVVYTNGTATTTVKTEGSSSPDGWDCDGAASDAECVCNLYTLLTGAGAITGVTVTRTDGTCSDEKLTFSLTPGAAEYLTVTTSDDTNMDMTSGTDGTVKVPDGSSSAPTLRFLGANNGFYLYNTNAIGYVINGTYKGYLGNSGISSGGFVTSGTYMSSGSYVAATTYASTGDSSYYAVGTRSRMYSPADGYLQTTSSTGTGASAWVNYPQTITCAAEADVSTCGGAQTITSNVVYLVNSDADGANLTLAETNFSATVTGNVIIHMGTSAGGTVTLADSGGVVELAGGVSWTPTQLDTICLSYSPGLYWAECGRADNTP